VIGKTCSRCGEHEAGPGGILCGSCRSEIEAAPLYPLLPDAPPDPGD
jgi:hypothetical protein